jgi:uncharacterized membrane protein YbhN (UPF0104 family)
MNELRSYPNFAKKLYIFVFSFAFLAIISFALCFYMTGKGNENQSNLFAVLAGAFIFIGLGGVFLKINTVKCHVCGGKTETIKNTEEDQWQAFCPKCNIKWNLGIGTNTD